jgi:hypothetical protein
MFMKHWGAFIGTIGALFYISERLATIMVPQFASKNFTLLSQRTQIHAFSPLPSTSIHPFAFDHVLGVGGDLQCSIL